MRRISALNSILYHVIKMIEEQGDSIVDDFQIRLRQTTAPVSIRSSGFTLNRFQGGYCSDRHKYRRSGGRMQLEITAPDLMELRCSDKDSLRDCSIRRVCRLPSGKQNMDLPDAVIRTMRLLQLVTLRSGDRGEQLPALSGRDDREETSASRHVATDLWRTRQIFRESSISEEYRRVYADAEYLAPLIGYTGQSFRRGAGGAAEGRRAAMQCD